MKDLITAPISDRSAKVVSEALYHTAQLVYDTNFTPLEALELALAVQETPDVYQRRAHHEVREFHPDTNPVFGTAREQWRRYYSTLRDELRGDPLGDWHGRNR